MKSSISIIANLPRVAVILLFFGLFSCSDTTYVHQNGTYYNDYKAVNHYRVQSATRGKKVKSQSKSPNWKQYNAHSRNKR